MRDVVHMATVRGAPHSQEEDKRQISAIQARLEEATIKNEALIKEIDDLHKRQAETQNQLSIAHARAADADKLRTETQWLLQEDSKNKALIKKKEQRIRDLSTACTEASKRIKEHLHSSKRDISLLRHQLEGNQKAIKQDISETTRLIKDLESCRSKANNKSNREHVDLVQELTGKIRSLEEKFIFIEKKNNELERTIAALTELDKEQQTANNKLQSELAELHRELKKTKQELSVKSEELFHLTGEKTYIEGQLAAAKAKIGKLEVSITQKEADLASTKRNIAGIEADISQTAQKVASLQEALRLQRSGEETKIATMKASLDSKLETERELREQLEQTESIKHECDQNLDKMNLELDALRNSVLTLTEQLSRCETRLAYNEGRLKDKDTELEAATSDLRLCKAREASLVDDLQEANQQKIKLEDKVRKHTDAIKRLESQIELQTKEIEGLKTYGAGKDNDLENALHSIAVAKLELQETNKRISDQTAELVTVNGSIIKLTDKLDSERKRRNEVEVKLAAAEADVKSGMESLGECNRERIKQDSAISALETQLRDVQKSAAEQAERSNSEVSVLADKLNRESEKIKRLDYELLQKANELDAAKNDIETLTAEKEKLESSIVESNGDSSKLRQRLDHIDDKIQTMRTSRDQLRDRLKLMRKQIENSKVRRASMAATIKNMKDAKDALERRNRDINARVDAAAALHEIVHGVKSAANCTDDNIVECIKRITRDHDALSVQLKTHKSNEERISIESAVIQSKVSKLTALTEDLNAKIKMASALHSKDLLSKSTLEKKLAEASAKLVKSTRRELQLTKEAENASATQRNLEVRLLTIQQDIDKLRDTNSEQTQDSAELTRQLSALQNSNQKLTWELEGIANALHGGVQHDSPTSDSYYESNPKLTDRVTELKRQDIVLSRLSDLAACNKGDAYECLTKTIEVSRAVKETIGVDPNFTDIRGIKEKIAELVSNAKGADEMQEEITRLNGTIRNQTTGMKALREELDRCEDGMANATGQHKQEIQQRDRHNTKLSSDLVTSNTKLRGLESLIELQQQAIGDKEGTISNLQSIIMQLKNESASSTKAKNEIEEQNKALTQSLYVYSSSLDVARQEKETSIREAQSKLDELRTQILQKQSEIDTNAIEIERLNRDILALRDESMKSTELNSSLVGTNTELNSRLVSCNGELSEANRGKEIMITIATRAKEEMELQQSTLNDLEKANSQLNQDLHDLKLQAEGAKNRCLLGLNMTEIPIIDRHIPVAIWETADELINLLGRRIRSANPQNKNHLAAFDLIKDAARQYIADGLSSATRRSRDMPPQSSITTSGIDSNDTAERRNKLKEYITAITTTVTEYTTKNGIMKTMPSHTVALSMYRIKDSLVHIAASCIGPPDIDRLSGELTEITKRAELDIRSRIATILHNAMWKTTQGIDDRVYWGDEITRHASTINTALVDIVARVDELEKESELIVKASQLETPAPVATKDTDEEETHEIHEIHGILTLQHQAIIKSIHPSITSLYGILERHKAVGNTVVLRCMFLLAYMIRSIVVQAVDRNELYTDASSYIDNLLTRGQNKDNASYTTLHERLLRDIKTQHNTSDSTSEVDKLLSGIIDAMANMSTAVIADDDTETDNDDDDKLALTRIHLAILSAGNDDSNVRAFSRPATPIMKIQRSGVYI
jgi:chromosome segregation ATPase